MVDVVTELMNADAIQFSQFTPGSSTPPFKDFCALKPSGQLAFTLNMEQAWGQAYPPVNLRFVGTVIPTNNQPGFSLVRWEVQKVDENLSEAHGEITTTLFPILPRVESATCNNLDRFFGVQLQTFGNKNQLTVTWDIGIGSESFTFDNIAFTAMAGEFIAFTVNIQPRTDHCGIFAVEGRTAKFFAKIIDMPPAQTVSYQWDVPELGITSTTDTLQFVIPQPSGKITITLSVNIDGIQRQAQTLSFQPATVEEAARLESICRLRELISQEVVLWFINPFALTDSQSVLRTLDHIFGALAGLYTANMQQHGEEERMDK